MSSKTAGDLMPESVTTSVFGPSFQFQDPDWLAWWLSSHFMLSPDDQIAVAERLYAVVHTPACREIIEGFIAVASTMQGGPDSESAPETGVKFLKPAVDHDETASRQVGSEPWWERALRASLERYRSLFVCGALVVAFYIYKLFATLLS